MKSKRLPRLWCALQGLLPLDACEAAQRAELAWPREDLTADVEAIEQRAVEARVKKPRAGARCSPR